MQLLRETAGDPPIVEISRLERQVLWRLAMSTSVASVVFSALPLVLALAYALAGLGG